MFLYCLQIAEGRQIPRGPVNPSLYPLPPTQCTPLAAASDGHHPAPSCPLPTSWQAWHLSWQHGQREPGPANLQRREGKQKPGREWVFTFLSSPVVPGHRGRRRALGSAAGAAPTLAGLPRTWAALDRAERAGEPGGAAGRAAAGGSQQRFMDGRRR